MKVVIEGRGLTAGGGMVGVLRTLPALAKQGHHQYVAYLPDMPEYAALDSPNLRVVLTPRCSNVIAREWWLNTRVRKICREERADALLCLGNFAPHFPPVPTIIRLQNAYYVYRDALACRGLTFRERLIVKYGREHFRHLAENVSVVVQTEVMKRRLLSQAPISPSRVMVIPDRGMSFTRFPERRAHQDASSPFTFLAVALSTPNKNLEVLVEAVKRLRILSKRPFRCLLTIDPRQHPAARELLAKIEREAVGDLLVNAGSLPPERLAAAYESADAFILPTLLESFCRPYDEAMHFGLPILTSDRDFARERCQGAAIYFDPLDAASVARAMAAVMEDSTLRQTLVENGRRILAQAPTWDEIAARFVEVLERTARQKAEGSRKSEVGSRQDVRAPLVGARNSNPGTERAGTRPAPTLAAHCPPPTAHCLLPSAHCPPPSAYRLPPTAHDVRALFNHKARRWRSKYGPKGKLNSRVEQFTARLAELCPAPASILDLGCGTGEIAAALDQMGYHVTACDLAEEMLEVARHSHSRTAVEWVCLAPGGEALPFADASFDGIVASSVFEYLDDVQGMAGELARVLRPRGIMLLTVPNPHNLARKLEARLRLMLVNHRLSPVLARIHRLDSYAAYLRLSRNRFEAQQWQSVLNAAHFAPLDERDFTPNAWRRQAQAPLVLVAVRRIVEQLDVEAALQPQAAAT